MRNLNSDERKAKGENVTIFLCIIGAILYFAEGFTPKSGELVMINEITDVLFVVVIVVAIIRWIKNAKPSKTKNIKALKIAVVIASLIVGIWHVKDLTLDLIGETQTITLENCVTGSQNKRSGLFTYYYIKGYSSDGEYYEFQLSADDRSRLSGSDTVSVEYYVHTERAIKIWR